VQRAGPLKKPSESRDEGIPRRGLRSADPGWRPLCSQTAEMESPKVQGAGAARWSLAEIAVRAPGRLRQQAGATPSHTLTSNAGSALLVGGALDEFERAAEQAVAQPGTTPVRASHVPLRGPLAPPAVHHALSSPGQPLAEKNRAAFERHFKHDFSAVRLHADGLAHRAARALGARAFTVADHIVLSRGEPTERLLAHELAHVMQQRSATQAWVQRQPAPVPRKDFVFIMGADPKKTGNPFYTLAKQYFQAHLPHATMVEDKRTLEDLLKWIASHVTDPVGNLYIVSHGAEDGTLGFGLDGSSKDHRMTVLDLRAALHPSGGLPGTLPSLGSVIDAQTRIHIKGCDIGRTKEMVELIDEAFGGAGTVVAPTHEQDYSTDSTLADQARKAAHDEKMGAFTAGLPELPPQPAKVDPNLKGDERKAAKKEYDAAVEARKTAKTQRDAAIAAEEKRIKPELDQIAAEAKTVDSLSGPMFQRPGTQLYTAKDLQPEIDRLYAHLPEDQRKKLAQQLVAPSAKPLLEQQGQKVDTIKPWSMAFDEPASLDEGNSLYGKSFAKSNFKATSMQVDKTPGTDDVEVKLTFKGKEHPPKQDPFDTEFTVTIKQPTEDSILKAGKAKVNNPDRYQWRVQREHAKSGKTKLTAVGERVIAYLHHGSLNVGKHERFSQPESNADFYYSSTFAPPPPPTPGAAAPTP